KVRASPSIIERPVALTMEHLHSGNVHGNYIRTIVRVNITGSHNIWALRVAINMWALRIAPMAIAVEHAKASVVHGDKIDVAVSIEVTRGDWPRWGDATNPSDDDALRITVHCVTTPEAN